MLKCICATSNDNEIIMQMALAGNMKSLFSHSDIPELHKWPSFCRLKPEYWTYMRQMFHFRVYINQSICRG